jgi:hypothetical protein
MKKIHIPLIDSISQDSPMEDISNLMDSLSKHHIDNEPWPNLRCNCQASFSIAHLGTAVLLKYYVNEDVIKVAMNKTNDPVYKDNCVEFFISFESEKEYYNIEINCVGVCLLGYGDSRVNRTILPENIIDKIRRNILIKSAWLSSSTRFEWQIALVIPIEVFKYTDLKSFAKNKVRGNFYKCGDDLPNPHFLAWNMIYAQNPDFHLPEFFGQLEFE